MVYEQIPTDLLEKASHRFEINAQAQQSENKRPGRVITVSRLTGSGAKEVLSLLGDELGWIVWDDKILDLLSKETHGHYQKRMFKSLDERAQNWITDVLSSFSQKYPEEVYVSLLPHVLHTIATQDAVILGRASHLFLPDSLRVLIKASRETRLKNIMSKLDLTRKEAEAEITYYDSNRENFFKDMGRQYQLIGERLDDELHFDIEINMDALTPSEAASIIASSARSKFNIE